MKASFFWFNPVTALTFVGKRLVLPLLVPPYTSCKMKGLPLVSKREDSSLRERQIPYSQCQGLWPWFPDQGRDCAANLQLLILRENEGITIFAAFNSQKKKHQIYIIRMNERSNLEQQEINSETKRENV